MRIIKDIDQNSQEWLDLRAGVITGSNLKKVMSTRTDTRKNYIYELISQKIAPVKEGFSNSSTERGHILEEVLKETKYTNYENVGFVFGDKERFGYSSDGVSFNEKGEIIEDIEVKSPESKTYVEYLIEGKIPEEYFRQLISGFVACNTLIRRRLIFNNPEVYDETLRIKEIVLERDDYISYIEEAKIKLEIFREERLENFKKLINLNG